MECNSPQLTYVPLDRLKLVWPFARRFILPAAYHAKDMTEEQIVWKIGECDLHLFTVEDDGMIGALTVRIREPFATVVHLGGDWDRMVELEDELATWAKGMGASIFRIQGRRGWVRKLPKHGFKERMVVMEKVI